MQTEKQLKTMLFETNLQNLQWKNNLITVKQQVEL